MEQESSVNVMDHANHVAISLFQLLMLMVWLKLVSDQIAHKSSIRMVHVAHAPIMRNGTQHLQNVFQQFAQLEVGFLEEEDVSLVENTNIYQLIKKPVLHVIVPQIKFAKSLVNALNVHHFNLFKLLEH